MALVYNQNNFKNKVIVTPARSGSSWLVSAFERQGYNSFPLSMSENSSLSPALQDLAISDYNVDERIEYMHDCQPFVTKVFCDDPIDLNRLLYYKNGTEFIWLYRKNKVEHFLSNLLAWETSVFHIEDKVYKTPDDIDITDEHMYTYETILIHEYTMYNKYKHMFNYEIEYKEIFDNNPWGLTHTDNMPVKVNKYNTALLQKAESKLKEWDLL